MKYGTPVAYRDNNIIGFGTIVEIRTTVGRDGEHTRYSVVPNGQLEQPDIIINNEEDLLELTSHNVNYRFDQFVKSTLGYQVTMKYAAVLEAREAGGADSPAIPSTVPDTDIPL
jgi:hypothetical protein